MGNEISELDLSAESPFRLDNGSLKDLPVRVRVDADGFMIMSKNTEVNMILGSFGVAFALPNTGNKTLLSRYTFDELVRWRTDRSGNVTLEINHKGVRKVIRVDCDQDDQAHYVDVILLDHKKWLQTHGKYNPEPVNDFTNFRPSFVKPQETVASSEKKFSANKFLKKKAGNDAPEFVTSSLLNPNYSSMESPAYDFQSISVPATRAATSSRRSAPVDDQLPAYTPKTVPTAQVMPSYQIIICPTCETNMQAPVTAQAMIYQCPACTVQFSF